MSSLVDREQAKAASASPPYSSRSSAKRRATRSSASSQLAGSSSPVAALRTSGAVKRSGASTKSKLPERPFTHSSPLFDGPGAPSASTMRPSFTTRSSWQPTPQCGQVVRTRSVSHER